jgi:hypothetical protein
VVEPKGFKFVNPLISIVLGMRMLPQEATEINLLLLAIVERKVNTIPLHIRCLRDIDRTCHRLYLFTYNSIPNRLFFAANVLQEQHRIQYIIELS